jgi:hypothetical protein
MNIREVEKLRAPLYRVSPARRVRTIAAAAQFIDQTGFCWLFAPERNVPELPSLMEAVKGRRDVHIEDWDEDTDLVWAWKNDLPAAHYAYYGKGLMGRPALVSLEMLPSLMACTGDEKFEHLYRHGGISYEAKKIYDTLLRSGPQPTIALRRAAGFDSKDGSTRYHRALDELQRRLFVMPVGATRQGKAWPIQIFELTARWFPEQTAQAHELDVSEAQRKLLTRYLKTVLLAKPNAIARLFGLSQSQVHMGLTELAERRLVRAEGEWVVWNKIKVDRKS